MSLSFSPTHISVEEMEFLAEESPITVLPMFSSPPLKFIEKEFGPFRPNFPLSIPLWLAIQLKKAKKCQIKSPAWLECESLESHLERERRDPVEFSPLPFHFDEIARLLIENAREDLVNPARVEELLGDIRDARQAKVRGLLQQIQIQAKVLPLGEIGAMELNALRDGVSNTLEVFHQMRMAGQGEVGEAMQGDNRRGGIIQQASQPMANQAENMADQYQHPQSQAEAIGFGLNFSQSQQAAEHPGNANGEGEENGGALESSQAPGDPQRKLRKFR